MLGSWAQVLNKIRKKLMEIVAMPNPLQALVPSRAFLSVPWAYYVSSFYLSGTSCFIRLKYALFTFWNSAQMSLPQGNLWSSSRMEQIPFSWCPKLLPIDSILTFVCSMRAGTRSSLFRALSQAPRAEYTVGTHIFVEWSSAFIKHQVLHFNSSQEPFT